jgi:hypothetical protein
MVVEVLVLGAKEQLNEEAGKYVCSYGGKMQYVKSHHSADGIQSFNLERTCSQPVAGRGGQNGPKYPDVDFSRWDSD